MDKQYRIRLKHIKREYGVIFNLEAGEAIPMYDFVEAFWLSENDDELCERVSKIKPVSEIKLKENKEASTIEATAWDIVINDNGDINSSD